MDLIHCVLFPFKITGEKDTRRTGFIDSDLIII